MVFQLDEIIINNFIFIVLSSLCITLVILVSIHRKDGNLKRFYWLPTFPILLLLFFSPFFGLFIGVLANNEVVAIFTFLYYQLYSVVLLGIIVSYCIFITHQKLGIHASLPVAAFLLLLPFVLLLLGSPISILVTSIELGLFFTPGFFVMFLNLDPLTSRKSNIYIDEQTRERVFGNTRNYDNWSISWLMIRLGNRVNNDGDKIALSALEYLLKQEDPIVRKAIEQVGLGIAEGEEDTTVYWIRQGEPNALDPGVRLPYRIDRYFMTNFEFQQKEKRIRTMYLAECVIMVVLTLLFTLFLTGLSQLYGVVLSLSMLGVSLLVEQHQRVCRKESVEAETIISFFDEAVLYLRARKSGVA